MSFPLSDFIIDLDPVVERRPLDLFEEKYKPKTEEEFYGNELAIQSFKHWDLRKYALCIVCGPKSSGKTTFVDLMLKDYNVAEYSDNMERKELFKHISRLIDTRSVLNQISSKNKPTAVLIDNAETFLGDGNNFDEFCKIAEDGPRTVPIVLTVSKMKKKMNKKTRFLLINLQPTNITILNKIVKRIIKEENLKIDNFSRSRLIENCKDDIRQLMHMLKLLTYSPENKLDNTNVERLIEFSSQDSFFDASASVDRIYNKTNISSLETLKTKMKMYDGEQYSIEQLLYSNLTKLERIETIEEILFSMSDSDLFQKYMYDKQEWDFKEYSLLSCVKAEIEIPHANYKIGKNCINNLQLNTSKNKTAIDKLNVDPQDVNLLFKLKKHYMEDNKVLDDDIDYETYSKLCNIYNLPKKTKKYFDVDN